ncbi:MAG: TonB-dependent receptor plug domain-containing protein [Alistipes sp.]|nr:TonB-dependent receptor plug domain-containing protein [Alistipes sp.]
MKRIFSFLALAVLGLASLGAQEYYEPLDTTRIYEVDVVEVITTAASRTAPVAHNNIDREAIISKSYALDLPSALALTPSMIATNETGIGIGATSIRLRGTDATRINVTVNGVAMNNPDSHSVYWYDTPDLISSVGSVQVQRGAGVSTNGAGAFGGAVSMTTDALSTEFRGGASLSYGSYNTNKQAVHISSGLMRDHWVVDARLSHIGSDGYIERGATDLKSYMAQVGYYADNTRIKLLSFGGSAKTYLTYNGVSREDMALYGRRYHTSGQYTTSDGPYVLADGTHVDYHDDETDNYLQINNHLVVNHRFNQRWQLNATLFYTYGYGYYNQYKDDAWLAGYTNLKNVTSEQADLIRHKLMRNHLGGANLAASYNTSRLNLTFGGSWSYYTCPHWGTVSWVDGMAAGDVEGRWYDNDVMKQDANAFVRAEWRVYSDASGNDIRLFGDMQYRYVHYKAWGVNDNSIWGDEGVYMQPIDVDKQYHFLNPHLGLSYKRGGHNLFISAAIANREPTRSDFTDRYMFSADDSYPESERLYDFELGYSFTSPRVSVGVNLYYMLYHNQLVATGMVNDGDDALNVNVDRSYRRGVELMASWRTTKWLTLSANATLSQNVIKDYVDELKDSPTYGQNLGDMTISYSPAVIGSLSADFHVGGFSLLWHTQYVGKQYFTNNEIEALSLDAYCVTNLDLGYRVAMRGGGSVRFGLAVNNLFSTLYESNGYGYSYMWDGERYDEAFYFPQAPINFIGNVTVNF